MTLDALKPDPQVFWPNAEGRAPSTDRQRIAYRQQLDHEWLKKGERGDYYRAIFDATPLASIVLTPDGRIRNWNLSAEELFGYYEDEVIDRCVSFLTSPLLLGHGPSLQEATWCSKTRRHWQTEKRCQDGSLIEVSIDSSPLFDDAGASIGMIWSVRQMSQEEASANLSWS